MAAVLFDPARHEALSGAPWSDAAARHAIRRIADDALQAFSPQTLWPEHPLDLQLPPALPSTGLYDGAGGVIWALRHLAAAGAIDALPAFGDTVAALAGRNPSAQEPDRTASLLIGNTGLLLLQWQISSAAGRADVADVADVADLADALFALVQGNIGHPSREALWGNAGSALAALQMAQATAEPRWQALLLQAVEQLAQSLETDVDSGTPVWVQQIGGHSMRYLGAGHGLAGNVYLALRAAPLLPTALVQRFTDAALSTLQATALHDGEGRINWHAMVDAARLPGRVPLVQDCHGAPGMLNRLAGMPRTAQWDALLLGAGELTWHAGPLVKGPGLCHGTAGNALALLKLAERRADALWLARARAMAAHAAGQVERARARQGHGRYTLWTGDLGVACVLWDCIQGRGSVPTLDVF